MGEAWSTLEEMKVHTKLCSEKNGKEERGH